MGAKGADVHFGSSADIMAPISYVRLARTAQPFHRQQLEQMAETWEPACQGSQAAIGETGEDGRG
jgi:hypothetical protein